MPIERLLKQQHSIVSRTPNPTFSAILAAPAPGRLTGPYLDVRSVATGLASLYEKLRNTLDYRDEHLIRIYAIRRVLKRRMVRGSGADRITEPLLRELIRSGYVPQDAVPEASLHSYQKLFEKYIQLFTYLIHLYPGNVVRKVWDWVFLLAANELEEKLFPGTHRQQLVNKLVEVMEDEDVLGLWPLKNEERRQQEIIAANRALLKLNNELISWELFKRHFPEWTQQPPVAYVQSVAQSLPMARIHFDKAMQSPASDRLARALKPATTALWLLLATTEKQHDRGMLLAHPDLLRSAMSETIAEFSKNAQRRLRRTLWRSLFYIFLTKMAFAVLLEIPTDRILQGHVNAFNFAFTIFVPLALLLVFGLSVRVPGKKNTDELLSRSQTLVYDGTLAIEAPRTPASRHIILDVTFNLVFFAVYLITFGAVVAALLRLDFTVVGIALFLIFLSIVSFFGFRIREQAQELIVTKGQERFLVFLPVMFFLPILRTGRWISRQSSRINIFLFFFDLFIEAPLQSFLEFFDKFTGFLREKREDITS